MQLAKDFWEAALVARIEQLRRDYANMLDRLKLQDPEYASLVSVAPLTLEQTQALLGNRTLVSYFTTASQTFAFVVSGAHFETVPLQVTESELRELIISFRGEESFASTAAEDVGLSRRPLAELHHLLVQPLLERDLLTTRHLVIVPHRILNSLPFAALWDETTRTYFGERYTLSYLPSASVLPFVAENANNPNRQRLLALANARPEGFSYLPSAVREAKAAANLYGTTAYLNEEATETLLKNEVVGKDIVLLAAHSELSEDTPLFSRIILAADETRREDGALTVQEIYELDLADANLVVLSASETNQGRLSRGDDLVGLTRAFIYAGAPSVVASLWRVDDEATRMLVTSFLAHYKQGSSAAAALAAAQAEVRAIPEYAHPYYWAAFVLLGAP